MNFSVDHYRPKGIHRFAHLVCDYGNLYYCCGSCNSRKNDYWPLDEKAGPFVVAPCEHEMAAHLRFNSTTGMVEARTPEGKHTEELLQLNDVATVQYRLATLRTVKMYATEIGVQQQLLKDLARLLRQTKITQAEHDSEALSIQQELDDLSRTMQTYSGDLPLPPIRRQRFGMSLVAP